MNEEGCSDRRDLLRRLTLAGAGLALAAADPLRGDCEGEEEEVAPAEDLMRSRASKRRGGSSTS